MSEKGKPFGYVCGICGDPIYDIEATAHSEDGLVHQQCLIVGVPGKLPTLEQMMQSQGKPRLSPLEDARNGDYEPFQNDVLEVMRAILSELKSMNERLKEVEEAIYRQ